MSVFRIFSKRLFSIFIVSLSLFIFLADVTKADHSICDHPVPNTLSCCIPELDDDCKSFSKVTICHDDNTITINLNALTNHFQTCEYVEPSTPDSQPLETPQGVEAGMTVCSVTVGPPAPPKSMADTGHAGDVLGMCAGFMGCENDNDCGDDDNPCSVVFCNTSTGICLTEPARDDPSDPPILCRDVGFPPGVDEECDLQEFCPVDSTACPENTFVPFGGECTIDGCEGQDICDGMGTCICFEGEEPIPTLSEWGLIFLMAFLFMAAVWRMKKHQSV